MKINLDVEVKSNNREVMAKLAKADKRFLHWYGGAVRKSIRRNVRKRKSVSKPGKGPTHWEGGDGGLRLVAYEVNSRGNEVTVGVLLFNNAKQRGRTPAPKLINDGGTAQLRFVFSYTPKGGADTKTRFHRPKGIPAKKVRLVYTKKAKPRPVKYQKRPFVTTAFEKMNAGLVEKYSRAIGRVL